MFALLFDTLFGCRHTNYSFPFSIRSGRRRSGAASRTGTYVVCLNCGRELAYDWSAMKVLRSQHRGAEAPQSPIAVKQAA